MFSNLCLSFRETVPLKAWISDFPEYRSYWTEFVYCPFNIYLFNFLIYKILNIFHTVGTTVPVPKGNRKTAK